MCCDSVQSLLDSMVVSSLSEADRVDLGRLRLFGELGNGVSSVITMNAINHDRGFKTMFVIHGVASAVTIVFMLRCLPKDTNRASKMLHTKSGRLHNNSDWKQGLRVIVGDANLLATFCLIAITGYSMSILEYFCYINIRRLYAETGPSESAGRDIGTFRAFYSFGGAASWYFSGRWMRALGQEAVMVASVCCLPVCFFLYSGAWWQGSVLASLMASSSELGGLGVPTKVGFALAEVLRGGIFAALWKAATLRANKMAPAHAQSVMQTMLEATYRGVGHTAGSYLGGRLCLSMEISKAFVVVGRGLSSFLCILGAMAYWTGPRQQAMHAKR